nr:catalase-related domain-containing protein [Acetobacter okinawensis]
MVRSAYTLRADDDDFGQAGTLVREVFDEAQRERLVETLAGQYRSLHHDQIKTRFLWYWTQIDATLAEQVKALIGA